MAQRQIILFCFECNAQELRKRPNVTNCEVFAHLCLESSFQSPRQLNRRQCRQPTPVPSKDGRPSFVSRDTCRAAKSEIPAAPVDALGIRTSCTLIV